MTYPNAYSGVKKVFTAQILILVGAILAFIVAVAGAMATTDGTPSEVAGGAAMGAAIGAGALASVTAILMFIAFIINLVGLHQAGKDEHYFRTAFNLTIAGIAVAVIQGIVNAAVSETAASGVQIVSDLLRILVMIYVIYGIIEIAKAIGDEKLQKKGRTLLTFITVLMIISIVIRLVADIAGDHMADPALVAMGAIGIVSALIVVISYILYLSLLSRAVKVFKNN